MTAPRILPCGDAACAVELGSGIDPAVNARVLALDPLAAELPGVVETVPTYRSLLVRYDPVATGFDRLRDALLELARGLAEVQPPAGRHWSVPVAYGGEDGADLDAVAARHGLSPEEVAARHRAPVYRVFMIGFLPGYAYLGGLDPSLATPRRERPRMRVPAGAIAVGGAQASVASIAGPSGWHLLGRTPVRCFVPGRDPAFILAPGDRVSFDPIPLDALPELDRAAARGELVARLLDGTPEAGP